MRKRANPPEKKTADREGSDFALTRAQRRRKLLGREEESMLPDWPVRVAAAKAAKDAEPPKTIGQRILEQTFGFFRRFVR